MKFCCLQRLTASFTARLIGTAVLVTSLTALAVNYAAYRSATRELHNTERFHGQSLAKILADSARLALFTNDRSKLKTAASLMEVSVDSSLILIFDENGKLFLRLDKFPEPDQAAAERLLASIEERLGQSPARWSFSLETTDHLVLVEPVLAERAFSEEAFLPETTPGGGQRLVPGTKILGYVAIQIDTSNERLRQRNVFLRDMALTLGLTLLSCLIIWGVILRLTRPLRQLVEEIVSQGEGGQRHGVSPDIPNDFSEMIVRVRQAYQSIRDFNLTLEEKVEVRTRQLAASNRELRTQKDVLAHTNKELALTLRQLQTTQNSLVQSEKMAALGMLIAGLSHEIKNSINFVTGSLPLLRKLISPLLLGQRPVGGTGEDQTVKIERLLSFIDEGVSRIVRVVDDLTFFSHSGSQEFEPVDILPGLQNSLSIIRHEHGRRLAIIENYEPGLPMVKAISGQLNQVFLNILVNAAQAIDGPGTITVRTWHEEGSVHVAISDTGHGIDSQCLGRIYDPFFTTKEVGKGTGLGLSISYSIIQKHGGSIEVQTAPGRGTCFEIILPMAG